MKKTILAVLLFLMGAASVPAANYEGLLIVKIDLKGNMNRDSTLIKAQLGSKVGRKFSYKTVSKDIKDLFFLGFFSDIKVDAKKIGGGVVLTFIFEEYEKIEKIIFKGNKKLSNSDLKELLTIKKGSVFNEVLISQNTNKMLDKYRQEGYINATVSVAASKDPKSKKATVIFNITEGKKIVVEKIAFKGTKQLESSSVDDAIEDTHESGLFRSGIFDQKKFDKDKERIVAYYHDRGFIDMKILKVEKAIRKIKPDKPKQGIFITIHVDEGKRFKMGKYSFSGNDVFTDKTIRDEIFRLKEGEYFNEGQFKKDYASLMGKYQERGYIYCTIVPDRKVDREKLIVNVSYTVVEMDKAHVEKIKIKGITRTKRYVVEREIRIKEGEIFNRSKIVRSQQRLMNLRFFKDVKIDVEQGSAEGLMNLIFSMKEDRTGLFTLGAGYGSVSGFTAYQQLSENNFLGRGLRVFERVEYGQKKKSVQLGIDTPYLIKYDPTSLGFTVSYNINTIESIDSILISTNSPDPGDDGYHYLRKSFEIQLRGGRTLGEFVRGYASYTWAWFKIYDRNFIITTPSEPSYITNQSTIDEFAAEFEGGYKTRSSLRIGSILDTRDYVGGPSRGIYLSQFFTYTGGVLGGDSQYILTDTKFSFFIPLMWKFVFAVDSNLEMIFSQFDGKDEVFNADKLRADGMTELRGWRSWQYYDSNNVLQTGVKTGRSKATFSIEIRYPIEKTMLWGVFFYDLGMVWDEVSDLNLNLKEYKHSIGFGFRLQLAMLPIRLYFAKRFHYPDGQLEWVGGSNFFKGWETVFSVAGIF